MALGMLGVLLILAASAAPAAPLPSNVPTILPPSISASDSTNISQSQIAVVANTHSMEPTLTAGDMILERAPTSASELVIGDIITYASQTKGITIVHRIVSLGSDEFGWYAQTKGDNAQKIDDERIRFTQVKGIVVAIINN